MRSPTIDKYWPAIATGLLLSLLGGCATYEAHYSKFSATNSVGEPRSFLLSWQTKRYPAWSLGSDAATPVSIRTQCSQREWLLRDGSTGACEVTTGPVNDGVAAPIRACGIPGEDLDRQGYPVKDAGHQCMSLTDSEGSATILELGQDLQLTVSCFPDETTRPQAGDIVNVDYLKASVVAYNVPVRTAPLYSMSQRPPELGDAVCAED